MDFNTLLERFGLDSTNFVNKTINTIEMEGGIIYEVEEENKPRICPNCNYDRLNIHGHKWIEIKLSSTIGFNEILRIKRIRYKCLNCGKTHTFLLTGIKRYKTVSNFVETAIKQEFYEIQSFATIARRYGLTSMQIINIFDDYTKIMLRRPLPEYLCIDEKHFEGDSTGKYVVIISDFFTGEVIDVLENRQIAYLDRYFSNISFKERNNVKVFISDMYEGYSTIKNKYFPKAIFVVDLFHVIKLLTNAVNKLRIRTYNQFIYNECLERYFMKNNWKIFLIDQHKINRNIYHSKKYDIDVPYGQMILRCLQLNNDFWDGYNVMQELFHYDKYETYGEADRFIERLIGKLNASGNELLCKVSDTYKKWKVGIIHGLARNQTGKRFSNAIAECNNSHIQKIIDASYGYKNFKRFRARIMLLLTYKKKR